MENNHNQLGTASLILGIISTVCFCLFHISITTGILAIVLGVKAGKKSQNHKGGKAGITTGIIGITACVSLYVTMLVLFLTGVIKIF